MTLMEQLEREMDNLRKRSALLELTLDEQRSAFEYARDAAAEPHETIRDHRNNRGE